MLHTFFAYCWDYFVHNLHVYNLLFNDNLHMCKIRKMGICREYVQHQLYVFAYAQHEQSINVCIVHIIIMRFAHMLYICQLHASFIYALCFTEIILIM